MTITEWLQLVHTIATGLLVVGVFLAWKSFQGDQDQRRRAYAMHLYDQWRALLDSHDVRYTLEMVRDKKLGGESLKSLLTDDESSTLVIGGKTYEYAEILELRRHIIAILNFFEQVAVARRESIGDPRIIDRTLGSAIMDHYSALGAFMSGWKEKRGRHPWLPLANMADGPWEPTAEGKPLPPI